MRDLPATDGVTSARLAPARRALFVLPYQMSARMVVHTPVLAALARQSGLAVTLISRDVSDGAAVADAPNLRWHPLPRPFRDLPSGGRWHPRAWRRLWGDLRFVAGFYLHLLLVYRFNSIAGFRGFRDRLKQSRWLRRAAFKEGLALEPWMGFPFPGSRRLLRWLKALYALGWQRHPAVEDLFDRQRPDLLVLAHLQTSWVMPFVLAAQQRGVPILGVNGSWDQPTTKGPLCPGVRQILVQSRRVAEDLHRYHGVDDSAMTVVGWPQMDIYRRADIFRSRDDWLAQLGLPAGCRYILIGAYAHRLGAHEPEMCAALARRIAAGGFGENVALYVRCHPLDLEWRDRLAALHDPPHVIVEPPQLGDLAHLANLLRHAAVLVASAGTINLDAVALDTPSIAIAWEDETEPYYDRPARRYDMEHYAAVVATGGVRLVHNEAELEAAIAAYLDDPAHDAEARARLRDSHLAPLDGQASQRLVAAIAAHAVAAEARP